jgi:hypothetical protein
MWFLALDHVTIKNDARWTIIKAELQRETEAIFHRSGEVLLVDFAEKSDYELALTSRTGQLKVTYVPERSAAKWETEKEYGFERIFSSTALLAESLIRRIHKLQSASSGMAWARATRQTAVTMSGFVCGIFSAKGRDYRGPDAERVSREGTLGWFWRWLWRCFRVVAYY